MPGSFRLTRQPTNWDCWTVTPNYPTTLRCFSMELMRVGRRLSGTTQTATTKLVRSSTSCKYGATRNNSPNDECGPDCAHKHNAFARRWVLPKPYNGSKRITEMARRTVTITVLSLLVFA